MRGRRVRGRHTEGRKETRCRGIRDGGEGLYTEKEVVGCKNRQERRGERTGIGRQK